MEENKKKSRLIMIIIISVAIIVAGVLIYLSSEDSEPPIPPNGEEYKPEPISKSQNPRRLEELNNAIKYGCGGPATIEPKIITEPNKDWIIYDDGRENIVSLGKYKIINPVNTVTDITKLWLFFQSDKLGREEDKIYALEKSYTAQMTLNVNGYEKEIKLGGDEYMLIELSDYPLGDIYPYDKETVLEFEFFIKLKCSNIKDGTCLNNKGKTLNINGADILPTFRLYAIGCQEFTIDIPIEAEFKQE